MIILNTLLGFEVGWSCEQMLWNPIQDVTSCAGYLYKGNTGNYSGETLGYRVNPYHDLRSRYFKVYTLRKPSTCIR